MRATRLLGAVAVAGIALIAWPGTHTDGVFRRKTEMLNTVVKVVTSEGSGSGTVIHSGNDGVFILTNHHVMPAKDKDQKLTVLSWVYEDSTGPASPLSQEVEIVADDEAKDLTLLRVTDPEWRAHYVAATIGPNDRPKQTEDVFVIGAGMGERVFATRGMISLSYVHPMEKDGPELEMISAPVIFGNSGGAAFVERCSWLACHYVLAGVPEQIRMVGLGSPLPHMAYAITMQTVRQFLADNGHGTLLNGRHT